MIIKIVGFSVIFLVALLIGWLFGGRYESAFDQNIWLHGIACNSDLDCAEKNDMACIRGGMVGDLKLRYLFQGMTRQEIESLLGSDYSSRKYDGQMCMDYDIGMCSGFRFDGDSLVLCLTSENTLARISTVQH